MRFRPAGPAPHAGGGRHAEGIVLADFDDRDDRLVLGALHPRSRLGARALLVSTLEHVGADNSGYGLEAEEAPASRAQALRELGRVLRPGGRLLVTVPLGEPGDHGWFRLD